MTIYIATSYNDGAEYAFTTKTAAITYCQGVVESWGEEVDDWSIYYYIDEIEFDG